MKILFLNPARSGQGNIPLSIPLLISILKKHNHEVRLFDLSDYAIFDDKSYEDVFFKAATYDEENILSDRRDFYKEGFGKKVAGRELKKTDYCKDFRDLLNEFKPSAILVNCLSVDFRFTCDFLRPFKQEYKIPIVFGGVHTILLPQEVLDSGVCDFACIGEGENCLPELMDAIDNKKPFDKIKGFWFKENGGIRRNSPIDLTDLSTLPVADFTCFDPIHFFRPFDGNRYKMVNYELSRGCPFKCSYCVNGVLQEKYKGLGKFNRVKNISQSIEELKFLIKKYRFDFVRFWDEDFTTIREDYLERYADAYINEINLPSIVYARVTTVTEKKVQILKKMGCRTFAMGIESGNESIRKQVLNRNMSNELIIDKFNLVKSYGIRVSAYNMIGFPYEKREHIFDTINVNRMVHPDSFSVTILEPYKGTPVRKMCEDEGFDPNYEVNTVHRPQFIPKGMTYDELNGIYRAFPFYVRFPKNRFDEIRLAETDDKIYQKLLKEFTNLKK